MGQCQFEKLRPGEIVILRNLKTCFEWQFNKIGIEKAQLKTSIKVKESITVSKMFEQYSPLSLAQDILDVLLLNLSSLPRCKGTKLLRQEY